MSPFRILAASARRHTVLVATTVVAYLVVYLLAIQNVVFARSLRAEFPSFELLPEWNDRLFETIAPFYFEPVAAIYVSDNLTVLLSPLNIVMGLVLGALVALNLAVAVDAYRHARACRRRAIGGLLGSLPGFLTGFACCVPTVALVLGAQFTVALIALRSWFFPVAVGAMSVSLLWNLR
jgi:hypothetical protein